MPHDRLPEVGTDAVASVDALCRRGPDLTVPIPDSHRVVAADIDGDPGGIPIVLVHGTPDSRLARHPDETIAADLGVRLIAVDRPGFGHSTAEADCSPQKFADDVAALLDNLGVEAAHLLALSAGTLWAMGAAGEIPERIISVTAVGALVPFEAFDEPVVRLAAGPARQGMVETAAELGASMAAELIAPMLVPDPPTPAASLEHRAESDDDDLDAVPGATVQMAAACCDAVRQGSSGLLGDVAVQLARSGVELSGLDVPVHLITGRGDLVCPPAFAHWYEQRIPGAIAEIVDDAGHGLLLTHWAEILKTIAAHTATSVNHFPRGRPEQWDRADSGGNEDGE